ncbi:MAG: hypothetical protein CMP65_05695 [Flavobacteriales bacterium]|nr:hypothetical protein [Flavobacteriales bacterium]
MNRISFYIFFMMCPLFIFSQDECEDETACNYGSLAPCEYPADNADCDGDCLENFCYSETQSGCVPGYFDDCGVCNNDPDDDNDYCPGCTDPTACNYDELANEDDDSCEYAAINSDCNGDCLDGYIDIQGECVLIVEGCTDSTACNYAELANVDDDSCEYAATNSDCNGDCLDGYIDIQGECVLIVEGCTDPAACNYDELANVDDNSCQEELVLSSEFTIPNCDTEDGFVSIDAIGVPPYTYNWNNGQNTQELTNLSPGIYSLYVEDGAGCVNFLQVELLNDVDNDGVCDENEIYGCDDVQALNYDSSATENDGTCFYCASYNFTDDENGLSLNGLGFQDATGVTISFWVYDDDWSLSSSNQEGFGYLVDLGHEDNYRYVVRWRGGVNGIQAYFEGSGFQQNGQGTDCDGFGEDSCYNYERTNVTYVIPPQDFNFLNDPIYDWWDAGECGWKNITAVFCSNSVKLYIDGIMVQQRSTDLYYPNPIFNLLPNTDLESWNIAGAMNGNTQSWDGQMDELRIWSRALSDQEILERVGENTDINLQVDQELILNLEGYWKFDSSLKDEVNGMFASPLGIDFSFSSQYCDYDCTNFTYNIPCTDDCDACTPAEGCMDINADNYDPQAEIDNGICIYYGCMDDGNHLWSVIPGLAACNYDPQANVNPFTLSDIENLCDYPEDIYGYGYVDCEGKCLFDCDQDGVCDWTKINNCVDDYGIFNYTDLYNNITLQPLSDGVPDCYMIEKNDNCICQEELCLEDQINNITLQPLSDGVPDCADDFDYNYWYNPLQIDVDQDDIGNVCDNEDGGQIGCTDIEACNYDFSVDISCSDCCVFCYLNDCENYPSSFYNCNGYCADLNSDGLYDDEDGDYICDTVDNCVFVWNPSQYDNDMDGVGDACEGLDIHSYKEMIYRIYPNPFTDWTLVEFYSINNSEKFIEIFETSGKLIWSVSLTDNLFKLHSSNFSKGLYLIEITQDSMKYNDILIVN